MSTYESDLLDRLDCPDLAAIREVLIHTERNAMDVAMNGLIAWLESEQPDEDVNPQEHHGAMIARARKFRERVLLQHIGRTSRANTAAPHWSKP